MNGIIFFEEVMLISVTSLKLQLILLKTSKTIKYLIDRDIVLSP